MLLELISAPPPFATSKEVEEASTNDSRPFLIDEFEDVVAKLQPAPALIGADAQAADALLLSGKLWLTEANISFLSSDGTFSLKGFQIKYPSIALHAISRSIPQDIPNKNKYLDEACIYCQLDDHPELDESQEEEDTDVKEMWFIVRDAEQCEASGNPFAGMAPFDTGALLGDAEEEEDDTAAESGGTAGKVRSDNQASDARFPYTNVFLEQIVFRSLQDRTARSNRATNATNTIMFANLPEAFFESEELVLQLQTLLCTYGHLVDWSPLSAFGRAVAVFEQAHEAANVKYALDRLLLLHEDLPTYAYDTHAEWRYLEPPEPEREFLLSPPGSPPVGWEPQLEDGPNKEALAFDLIAALQKLLVNSEETKAEEPVLPFVFPGGPAVIIPAQETTNAQAPPAVFLHATDEAPDQVGGPPPSAINTKASMLGVSSGTLPRATALPPSK
ncbi:Cbp1p [Malassezia vespertilionis]|uniref:Cbp1p n=1 Tax=Malassezia vespertilionis TaxID=2020962 RepID=A0A2N1JCY2_9BASI|nr:Cbp1p [Malassezia vespertilionis]